MKKFFSLFCTAALLFVSCATAPKNYEIAVHADTEPAPDTKMPITITVNPIWNSRGFSGFDLLIKNNTKKVVSIDWARSGIMYEGTSLPVFTDGQLAAQINTPMPPTLIAGDGLIQKTVCSSAQPLDSLKPGKWSVQPVLTKKAVQLILYIETAGTGDYYTITINPIMPPTAAEVRAARKEAEAKAASEKAAAAQAARDRIAAEEAAKAAEAAAEAEAAAAQTSEQTAPQADTAAPAADTAATSEKPATADTQAAAKTE